MRFQQIDIFYLLRGCYEGKPGKPGAWWHNHVQSTIFQMVSLSKCMKMICAQWIWPTRPWESSEMTCAYLVDHHTCHIVSRFYITSVLLGQFFIFPFLTWGCHLLTNDAQKMDHIQTARTNCDFGIFLDMFGVSQGLILNLQTRTLPWCNRQRGNSSCRFRNSQAKLTRYHDGYWFVGSNSNAYIIWLFNIAMENCQ